MADTYTDLLIHIRYRPEGEQGYPVEATLSDGSFFSGRIGLDEQALRVAALEADWDQYGRILYKALLAGGTISRAYNLASGLARQQSGERLRVRIWLDSRAAELHQIRWELLQHNVNKKLIPLSITSKMPFSRYTALGIAEPQPIKEQQVSLLVAISNPSDLKSKYKLEPVDVEEEVKHLRQALGDLVSRERVKVTLMPGQGGLSPDLQEQLKGEGYEVQTVRTSLENIIRRLEDHHVIHFLGHGAFPKPRQEGGERHARLYLEKRDGTTELVPDIEIEDKFRAASNLPQLVFLAACDSAKPGVGESFVGLAPRLVQAGTPAVVAMQDKISMTAARDLTHYFYEQLLQYGVVDQALNRARNLLYEEKNDSWAIPTLFMRLQTGVLFTPDPVPATVEAMRRHEKFNWIDPARNLYIPMPIEVVHVIGDQGCGNMELLEQQGPAGIEALKAVEELLNNEDVTAAATTIAVQEEAPVQELQKRPQLVALLGGFGSNKSTQMKRLVWNTLNKVAHGSAKFCLPIYVDLRAYQPVRSTFGDPLEEAVLKALGYYWPDLTADRLSKLPGNLELRLLFYGTDSLTDRDREETINQLRGLMRRYSNYQYVLASRPTAIDWDVLAQEIDLHLLLLQPLRPTKIRHFLENLDNDKRSPGSGSGNGQKVGQNLLAKIYQSQLFDLASIPHYMVKLLQQAQRGYYPSCRTEALAQWVDGAIARVTPKQGMRARAAETIYQVAWKMQIDRQLVWPVGEAFQAMDEVRGARGYDLESMYGDFLEQDLLAEVGDTALRFTYFPVQAYCSAQAILARPDRERVLADLTSMVSVQDRLSWWEDTLVFVCGLLAARDEDVALQQLMSRIVYDANLLEGEQLFLAARCMMESQSKIDELASLQTHVVNALRWRTSGQNEPRSVYRVQATELLSRLGDPATIVDLAGLVYEKARKNLKDEADFEYSSVRMAAAIGLKRMEDPKKVDQILGEISDELVILFHKWEAGDVTALIDRFKNTQDRGVQAITALALGDLEAQASLEEKPRESSLALACLMDAFKNDGGELSLPVLWAVADALAMLDSVMIARKVVQPMRTKLPAERTKLLAESTRLLGLEASGEIVSPEQTKELEEKIKALAEKTKTLAYLIGLIRSQEPANSKFIKEYCMGETQSVRMWLTAIKALGRLANRGDRKLMAAIATENKVERYHHTLLDEVPLAQRFPKVKHQNHIRRRAIAVLADIGDLDTLAALQEAGFEGELSRAFYQVASAIYRRVG